MEIYQRFLYEYLRIFFGGFEEIFKGIIHMFYVPDYIELITEYKDDFSGTAWIGVALAITTLIVIVGLIVLLIILLIKKNAKRHRKYQTQEAMAQQIDNLNEQVEILINEKMKLMDIISPDLMQKNNNDVDNSEYAYGEEGYLDDEESEESENTPVVESRFSKLIIADNQFAKYKQRDYKNNFELPEFCYRFRNYAAGKKGLYYSEKTIRLFVSALASTKLVILQGISGTGKTSICLAWGDFVKHFPCVASVQPSWRDRTDMLGYFNEFTKKFNETDFLNYLYCAGFQDEVFTVVLDEMNLARVEYYFAEMLSILEMHDTNDWKIEVVQNIWPSDPKRLINGKLQIPVNTWYIGTINNDDSTFTVTDKVYDRAMPIDINEKGVPFEADDCDAINLNYSYLDKVFRKAIKENALSPELMKKVNELDDYTITHFRVAFGNRIVKHMGKFVPVYKACGGDEIEGLDYFVAKKILRKFESLNQALIRDEIDGYIKFLDDTFGKGKMAECIEFLKRLKKSSG